MAGEVSGSILYYTADASDIPQGVWERNDFPFEKFFRNDLDESAVNWKPNGANDETIKTVSARLEDTKEETDDARRWIDLIQKYSAIDELTAPLLNELIEKIVVHQSWKDGNGKTVRAIEIYYRFVGKID